MRRAAIVGRHLSLGLAGLFGVLLLAGAALAQDAASIAQAQAALEAARSTRAVRALAAPELEAAEQALARALAARAAERPRGEIEHFAYLAERRAVVAWMYARERQGALALRRLSATHALVTEARAAKAEAAERRAMTLAERLAGFEVRAERQGLLLTPRGRWFDGDLAPAPGAVRAIAEAARLLGALPEHEAVVLGYALHPAPRAAAPGRGAAAAAAPRLPAHRQQADAAPATAGDREDLGCVRADLVRAFLISRGVDPRRIVANCLTPPGSTGAAAPLAGTTTIMLLPAGFGGRGAPEQSAAPEKAG